jgi:hypothetical protein
MIGMHGDPDEITIDTAPLAAVVAVHALGRMNPPHDFHPGSIALPSVLFGFLNFFGDEFGGHVIRPTPPMTYNSPSKEE